MGPGDLGRLERHAAGLTGEFLDPEVNGTYAVRPRRVIALSEADFSGSPTRWRFGGT